MLPGLATNGYALGGQSARFFYDGQYEQCYAASKKALEQDPYQLGVLPVHVAALVQLGHKGTVRGAPGSAFGKRFLEEGTHFGMLEAVHSAAR